MIPLNILIFPIGLFLQQIRKIFLRPRMDEEGFFDNLADDGPEILHRRGLILEYPAIPFLPNVPHQESWNELPQEV